MLEVEGKPTQTIRVKFSKGAVHPVDEDGAEGEPHWADRGLAWQIADERQARLFLETLLLCK